MKLKRIIKSILKNLLIFIISAIIGTIVSDLWLIWFWLPNNSNDVGLSIIAIAPVMLILFSAIGAVAGGILGLILFHIKRLISKSKRQKTALPSGKA